jgi:hypothetical protein
MPRFFGAFSKFTIRLTARCAQPSQNMVRVGQVLARHSPTASRSDSRPRASRRQPGHTPVYEPPFESNGNFPTSLINTLARFLPDGSSQFWIPPRLNQIIGLGPIMVDATKARRYPRANYAALDLDYQYFTRVGRISDFWCAWQAYACHAHQKSGFFKMFRELLIIDTKAAKERNHDHFQYHPRLCCPRR